LKDAAKVLDIHERRVTQALDPALDKIADLWIEDATKTMEAILSRVQARLAISAMGDREILLRGDIHAGRADRDRLFRKRMDRS